MMAREWLARLLYRPNTRFSLLVFPGVIYLLLFLLIPALSIVIFSFWRTESYVLYADWNVENYRIVLTERTYLTFLLRSFVTSVLVSLGCLVYAWPVAYFIAKHGGRYRLLLIVALAAPFFTGILLRVAALQSIFGPIGLVNMALMNLGLPPVEILMYTKLASGIGIAYIYVPFMVTAIYLSLVNFNFDILEVAKVNGARPWRAFVEITWPLNRIGTVIGVSLVFIPSLAASITPEFLGGPDGAAFGSVLSKQFGSTGTWALGSAMGVVLFVVSFVVLFAMWRRVNLKRSGFTGRGV